MGQLAQQFGRGVALVTVTGLAGVGKTALAQTFRQQAFPHFDSTVFLDLTRLPVPASPEALWHLLMEALGLPPTSTQVPDRQVIDHLRDDAMLLIFDNFEPYLRLRPLIRQLLHDCPKLGILITSRERLGLDEESVFAPRRLRRTENGESVRRGAQRSRAVAFLTGKQARGELSRSRRTAARCAMSAHGRAAFGP